MISVHPSMLEWFYDSTSMYVLDSSSVSVGVHWISGLLVSNIGWLGSNSVACDSVTNCSGMMLAKLSARIVLLFMKHGWSFVEFLPVSWHPSDC